MNALLFGSFFGAGTQVPSHQVFKVCFMANHCVIEHGSEIAMRSSQSGVRSGLMHDSHISPEELCD
jgi:hypothetical protein